MTFITLFAGWFFATVLVMVILLGIGLVIGAIDDHATTAVTLTGTIEPREWDE